MIELVEKYHDFHRKGDMKQEDLAAMIVYYGWTYCFRDFMHLDDYERTITDVDYAYGEGATKEGNE